MRPHVMLDLETMGTAPGSAIIAIGAVRFVPNNEINPIVEEEKFYRVITLKSAMHHGLTCDPDTILFWMKQGEDARGQFSKVAAMSLMPVLNDFAAYLKNMGGAVCLWGNGSDFDNVLLAEAYRRTGIEQPWKFWDNRCYRTIKNMQPSIKLERVGTYHNALDDAESQARHLVKIFGHMGSTDYCGPNS